MNKKEEVPSRELLLLVFGIEMTSVVKHIYIVMVIYEIITSIRLYTINGGENGKYPIKRS